MQPLTIGLMVLHGIVSLALIIIVLLQQGKTQGLSGAIAGGAETFFGKNKARTIDAKLKKFTTVMAALFIINSIALGFAMGTGGDNGGTGNMVVGDELGGIDLDEPIPTGWVVSAEDGTTILHGATNEPMELYYVDGNIVTADGVIQETMFVQVDGSVWRLPDISDFDINQLMEGMDLPEGVTLAPVGEGEE